MRSHSKKMLPTYFFTYWFITLSFLWLRAILQNVFKFLKIGADMFFFKPVVIKLISVAICHAHASSDFWSYLYPWRTYLLQRCKFDSLWVVMSFCKYVTLRRRYLKTYLGLSIISNLFVVSWRAIFWTRFLITTSFFSFKRFQSFWHETLTWYTLQHERKSLRFFSCYKNRVSRKKECFKFAIINFHSNF